MTARSTIEDGDGDDGEESEDEGEISRGRKKMNSATKEMTAPTISVRSPSAESSMRFLSLSTVTAGFLHGTGSSGEGEKRIEVTRSAISGETTQEEEDSGEDLVGRGKEGSLRFTADLEGDGDGEDSGGGEGDATNGVLSGSGDGDAKGFEVLGDFTMFFRFQETRITIVIDFNQFLLSIWHSGQARLKSEVNPILITKDLLINPILMDLYLSCFKSRVWLIFFDRLGIGLSQLWMDCENHLFFAGSNRLVILIRNGCLSNPIQVISGVTPSLLTFYIEAVTEWLRVPFLWFPYELRSLVLSPFLLTDGFLKMVGLGSCAFPLRMCCSCQRVMAVLLLAPIIIAMGLWFYCLRYVLWRGLSLKTIFTFSNMMSLSKVLQCMMVKWSWRRRDMSPFKGLLNQISSRDVSTFVKVLPLHNRISRHIFIRHINSCSISLLSGTSITRLPMMRIGDDLKKASWSITSWQYHSQVWPRVPCKELSRYYTPIPYIKGDESKVSLTLRGSIFFLQTIEVLSSFLMFLALWITIIRDNLKYQRSQGCPSLYFHKYWFPKILHHFRFQLTEMAQVNVIVVRIYNEYRGRFTFVNRLIRYYPSLVLLLVTKTSICTMGDWLQYEISISRGYQIPSTIRFTYRSLNSCQAILDFETKSTVNSLLYLLYVDFVGALLKSSTFGWEVDNYIQYSIIACQRNIVINMRELNLYYTHLNSSNIFTLFLSYDLYSKNSSVPMSQLSLMKKDPKQGLSKMKMKIKVPTIDNSGLMSRSSKILLGRCLNPMCQDVDTFLHIMPKLWQLKGRAQGLNLGSGRFQFEFESEQELQHVLQLSSSHFDGWMVTYAPWKPYAGADYPQTICFWVHITGIPFEYSTEEILRLVGGFLGRVKDINVDKRKLKLEIPCSKPLVFNSTLEFEDGQETQILIEYKNLKGYCKLCFRLTHNSQNCFKVTQEVGATREGQRKSPQGSRNKSYKDAINTRAGPSDVVNEVKRGHMKSARFTRPNPKQGSHQVRNQVPLLVPSLEVVNDYNTINTEVRDDDNCSVSAKKICRPLFQHDELVAGSKVSKGNIKDDIMITQEACGSLKQTISTNEHEPYDDEGTYTDALIQHNSDSDLNDSLRQGNTDDYYDNVEEDGVGSFTEKDYADYEDEKDTFLEEDVNEEVLVHHETKLLAKKPPLHPPISATRSGTPIRGISMRKMMTVGAMSPRSQKKENKGKGKKHKEQDHGSLKN